MTGSSIKTHALALKAGTIKTISSGVITADQWVHIIAAETGTADILATITPDYTALSIEGIDYRPNIFVIADSGDTITLEHGSGNLDLPGDTDITLTDDSYLHLLYDGTNWGIFSAPVVGGGLSNPVDNIQFNTGFSPGAHSDGNLYWDSSNNTAALDLVGSEVSLQLGQEMHVFARNISGGDIDNGEAIYITGVDSSLPTIDLADASALATTDVVAIATEDIVNNSNGYVTTFGYVRDIDTNTFTPGDIIYLSDSTPGAFTATKPDEPSFQRKIGTVIISDASVGSILVDIDTLQTLFDLSTNTQSILDLANGGTLDSVDVTVTATGGVITLSAEKSGSGNVIVKFSTGFFTWITAPDTITLTAGSDTSPTLNYVYLLESNKTLTTSTVSFPAAEHSPVATVLCQSANTLENDGAYKVHVWTDHMEDANEQGHLAHLNSWIRQQNATWIDGVAQTLTITPNGGAADNVIFTTASGNVLQLHSHAFPAFSGTPDIYIVNDSITAFDKVTDLNTQLLDSTGASMSGKYFSLVIWGVVSEASADCKLFCNLPGGSYGTSTGITQDANKFANYSIPSDFKGTGFLISELKLRHQTTASGTWTSIDEIDLRSLLPAIQAGSGGVGATEFSDNTFLITDDGDNTKGLAFQVSGVDTATTRTMTVPNASGTIALDPTTIAGDIIYSDGTDLLRLAIGSATEVLTVNAGATAPEWAAAGGGGAESHALVEDQKAQNTDGGTFTSGAKRTRDLNTIVYDADTIVSISQLAFTSGSEEPSPGDSLVGATNGATATLFGIGVITGTWGGGDAAGIFWLVDDQVGAYIGEDIDISGGSANVATVAADSSNDGSHALLAGTYRIEASCPAKEVVLNQSYYENTSDTTTEGTGQNARSASADDVGVISIVKARFTIASLKVFEVQHQCTTTISTDGFGEAINLTTEVYTQLEITKEA